MQTAIELGKNAAEFQRTTGVNYVTFTLILEKVVSDVAQYQEQNPISKRGRKGTSLDLSQVLLLPLMYMRQYHTFLSLGQAFSVSESYAPKRYCYVKGGIHDHKHTRAN